MCFFFKLLLKAVEISCQSRKTLVLFKDGTEKGAEQSRRDAHRTRYPFWIRTHDVYVLFDKELCNRPVWENQPDPSPHPTPLQTLALNVLGPADVNRGD